eukprot:2594086-Pleurochrysis_carterae.AAC.3
MHWAACKPVYFLRGPSLASNQSQVRSALRTATCKGDLRIRRQVVLHAKRSAEALSVTAPDQASLKYLESVPARTVTSHSLYRVYEHWSCWRHQHAHISRLRVRHALYDFSEGRGVDAP